MTTPPQASDQQPLFRPIAACAIVRNEERGIAEWIAYHLAIGFSTLILYDNASTDATPQAIERMARIGDVRGVSWAHRERGHQVDAYNDALVRFGDEFDWLFFIDADEFVLPLSHRSIAPVMAEFAPDVAAVGFNWLMYGSSGLHEQPADQLVLEAFQHHSDPSFPANRHVKTAVRPNRTIQCINPHYFDVVGPYVLADGSEAEWHHPGIAAKPPSQYGSARINHYFTKSWSYWETKMARGFPSWKRTAADFEVYDRNEHHDDRILQYLEITRRLIAAGMSPDD